MVQEAKAISLLVMPGHNTGQIEVIEFSSMNGVLGLNITGPGQSSTVTSMVGKKEFMDWMHRTLSKLGEADDR